MDRTAAAAFAVVLGISALWGQHDRGINGRAGAVDAGTPETAAASGISAPEGEGIQTRSMDAGGSGETAVPELDLYQKEVLAEIMESLKAEDLKAGASVMEKEEEMLQTLFYEVMGGERYLYDGETLSGSIEGEGMVLTMPSTVYYGTFKDGKPEGACTALQMVDLDAPRYDYSQGQWKDGKMEGKGHTGYCYYDHSPEGQARDVCKSGTFSGDLMDGEVIYTTMNGEDDTSTWELEVEQGIILLDESWVYNEEQGEYQLMSVDNDSHAYVMEEALSEIPVWKNLLIWEE